MYLSVYTYILQLGQELKSKAGLKLKLYIVKIMPENPSSTHRTHTHDFGYETTACLVMVNINARKQQSPPPHRTLAEIDVDEKKQILIPTPCQTVTITCKDFFQPK